MRSRDGNRPFVFTACTLILTGYLIADDFYIGYRLTSKDIQPYNETLLVSKAMQPCDLANNPFQITLERNKDESLNQILLREQSAFLDFASFQALHVKSNDHLTSSIHTLTSLTVPIRCYAVEFNDDSVTITSTKE